MLLVIHYKSPSGNNLFSSNKCSHDILWRNNINDNMSMWLDYKQKSSIINWLTFVIWRNFLLCDIIEFFWMPFPKTMFSIIPIIFSGNYSVYGMEIKLSRCVSPYLLNVYLPTAIFVVMSWVSFLIPTDVVPARIVLLVTLCLVIINTFNNVT